MDIIVKHFDEVDLSEIDFPVYTIFDKPSDYPNKYVARLWDLNKPTNVICLANTLVEIRNTIPNGMTLIPRFDKDDEKLIESWL